MASPQLGVICGMASEARALGCWRGDGRIAVAISGARPERAEAEARRLVAQGAAALLSWGIAGALEPGLRSGDLLRPATILGPLGERWAVTLGPVEGVLAGSDSLVSSDAEKAALRAATGAVAVDMESHRVAKVAAEAGLAFGVIRAVSDPAHRQLPALAAHALTADGKPRIRAVISGLMRRPGDLAGLIRAGRDSARALHALKKAAPEAIAFCLRDISAG